MSTVRHTPTRVVTGEDGSAAFLADCSARRVGLLVDAGLGTAPVLERVRSALQRAGATVDTTYVEAPGTADSAVGLAERHRDHELIVAVGGGSLMDQAKLARLLIGDPSAERLLRDEGRCGLITVPGQAHGLVPLVAVPTTLGTGAEVSRAACLLAGGRKRLAHGEALVPDTALLRSDAYETLPPGLVMEGLLEILFRGVGALAGGHKDLPTEDALMETVIARLLGLADLLGLARATGRPPEPAWLTDVAVLSGLTHSDWLQAGRTPFSVKGWYIANELSVLLGVAKMRAVAALLPPLWSAIATGDDRFGSPHRLERVWQHIRDHCAVPLPEEPGPGIGRLVDAWGVDRRIRADEDQVHAVARAAIRAWGAGLPMLAGIRHKDVQSLVTRAIDPPNIPLRENAKRKNGK